MGSVREDEIVERHSLRRGAFEPSERATLAKADGEP